MARDLPSLPLHPDAEKYYQEAGYSPKPPEIVEQIRDWLKSSWHIVAILVILTGAYRGLLLYRRNSKTNEIGRRILEVSTEANEPDSVRKLLEIRNEIRERVCRQWWRPGELDRPRWRHLNDLINDGIHRATENLTRALAGEIRGISKDPNLDDATRRERLQPLEERVWRCFGRGELEASERGVLVELIRESIHQTANSKEK